MKKNFSFMMDAGLLRIRGLVFLFILNNFLAIGQSCDSMQCCCDRIDLNPSGIMIGHRHSRGKWMFSYRYMNMQTKDNMSGTSKVNDDMVFQNYIMSPKNMNMDMHMVMAMYGITNRLSLMAMLNYNVLSMNMNMLPGSMQMQMNGMTMANMDATHMTTRTAGLGDTRVYATYSLIDKSIHQLIFSAGINIPTGSIQMKGDDKSMLPGQRLPYMMQLGSGTYDLLPGVTYLLRKETFTWGTQVTGVFRPGYNAVGYAYGNEVTATSWLAYRVLPWMSASARLEANCADVIYGKDPNQFEVMEPDSKSTNYGGKRASGYFGLNVYLKKFAGSKFSFEYGLPFYQNLNGTQQSMHSILYAGWGLSF
jgi:hypothetical protein